MPGDRVITPTDEVARVVEATPGPSGELELEYVDALNREHAKFTIRASHCVLWPHERPRPRPIRKRF